MAGISFDRTKLKYRGKPVATLNCFTKDELGKIAKTFNKKDQIIETNEIDGEVIQITSLFREEIGKDLVVELSGHEEIRYALMKSKSNEKWFPVVYESPSRTRVFALTLVEKPQGYLVLAAHPGFPTKPSPTDDNIRDSYDSVEDSEYFWKQHAFCAPACYENGLLIEKSESFDAPW